MKKDTLIFDLDGTLYYQRGVQLVMGCQMLLYYIFHFWKWKELNLILDYRKIREKNEKDVVEKQFKIMAEKYKMSVKQVEELVEKWMIEKPLKALKLFKDRKLSNLIENAKTNGIQVIIYSDYPTEDKLKIMGIKYDKAYDSTHQEIRTLKPDKKGLEYIIKSNGLNNKKILFIGDRDSKDGECARRCNVDYIILPKYFRKRKYDQIKSFLEN